MSRCCKNTNRFEKNELNDVEQFQLLIAMYGLDLNEVDLRAGVRVRIPGTLHWFSRYRDSKTWALGLAGPLVKGGR